MTVADGQKVWRSWCIHAAWLIIPAVAAAIERQRSDNGGTLCLLWWRSSSVCGPPLCAPVWQIAEQPNRPMCSAALVNCRNRFLCGPDRRWPSGLMHSAVARFLERVSIARNADRCNNQSDSVRPSICLSVRLSHSDVLSRWMKIRFCGFQLQVKNHSCFWRAKVYPDIRRGSPPAKALKWTPSLAKIWPIIGHNFEMMQDRRYVGINH